MASADRRQASYKRLKQASAARYDREHHRGCEHVLSIGHAGSERSSWACSAATNERLASYANANENELACTATNDARASCHSAALLEPMTPSSLSVMVVVLASSWARLMRAQNSSSRQWRALHSTSSSSPTSAPLASLPPHLVHLSLTHSQRPLNVCYSTDGRHHGGRACSADRPRDQRAPDGHAWRHEGAPGARVRHPRPPPPLRRHHPWCVARSLARSSIHRSMQLSCWFALSPVI